MKSIKQTPSDILQRQLTALKKQNPSYSLRALARDLDMSASFVSDVVKGKRQVPKQRVMDFKRILKMDIVTRNLFDQAMKRAFLAKNAISDEDVEKDDFKSRVAEYSEVQRKKSNIYNHWYNIAIMDLLTCKGVIMTPSALAKRLNISPEQVRMSLSLLEHEGFIEKKDDRWNKVSERIRFPTTYSMESIRGFHGQMIDLAKQQLTQETSDEAFKNRLINGVTMAINPDHLEKAKARLNDAICEIAEMLTEGECTEVYQLNCQLFSLTKKI